jgi:hypothetical protein
LRIAGNLGRHLGAARRCGLRMGEMHTQHAQDKSRHETPTPDFLVLLHQGILGEPHGTRRVRTARSVVCLADSCCMAPFFRTGSTMPGRCLLHEWQARQHKPVSPLADNASGQSIGTIAGPASVFRGQGRNTSSSGGNTRSTRSMAASNAAISASPCRAARLSSG